MKPNGVTDILDDVCHLLFFLTFTDGLNFIMINSCTMSTACAVALVAHIATIVLPIGINNNYNNQLQKKISLYSFNIYV